MSKIRLLLWFVVLFPCFTIAASDDVIEICATNYNSVYKEYDRKKAFIVVDEWRSKFFSEFINERGLKDEDVAKLILEDKEIISNDEFIVIAAFALTNEKKSTELESKAIMTIIDTRPEVFLMPGPSNVRIISNLISLESYQWLPLILQKLDVSKQDLEEMLMSSFCDGMLKDA